jgi:hypothetical protein
MVEQQEHMGWSGWLGGGRWTAVWFGIEITKCDQASRWVVSECPCWSLHISQADARFLRPCASRTGGWRGRVIQVLMVVVIPFLADPPINGFSGGWEAAWHETCE